MCGPWPFCFKSPVFVFFPTTIPMLHHSVVLEVVLFTSFLSTPTYPGDRVVDRCLMGFVFVGLAVPFLDPLVLRMCTDQTQALHHA